MYKLVLLIKTKNQVQRKEMKDLVPLSEMFVVIKGIVESHNKQVNTYNIQLDDTETLMNIEPKWMKIDSEDKRYFERNKKKS